MINTLAPKTSAKRGVASTKRTFHLTSFPPVDARYQGKVLGFSRDDYGTPRRMPGSRGRSPALASRSVSLRVQGRPRSRPRSARRGARTLDSRETLVTNWSPRSSTSKTMRAKYMRVVENTVPRRLSLFFSLLASRPPSQTVLLSSISRIASPPPNTVRRSPQYRRLTP